MSNYQQATGQSIDDAFAQYHANNPKVWETFQEQCFRAVRLQRTKISAKQIIGYIRWHVAMTTNSNDNFKVNDAFTSRYARLFAEQYPQYKDLFNYRELRSGEETIKRELLTTEQITALILTNMGYMIKISNYIEIVEITAKHRIDNLTFARLLKLKFIEKQDTDYSNVEKYITTATAKKYLETLQKPVNG